MPRNGVRSEKSKGIRGREALGMKKNYINFKAMGLALIFLFNPNIAIIDVLPDFIGYILLCLSIVKLSDISETVAEALTAFKRLVFIDAAKLVAILWVFGMSVTTERNSSLLLWSFAFGVLEYVFVIPAFIKLFKGITELGCLYENTSVLAPAGKGRRKRSRTESICALTVAFVALKATMSYLPELADLTSTEYYENSGLTNLYRYIGIMRFLAFVPVLLLGIVWLVRMLSYFLGVSNDTRFNGALNALYSERVAGKKGIFVKRSLRLAFVLLVAALVTSIDFRMENVNIFPDFIAAVLFFAFFVVLSKSAKTGKAASRLICALYFAATAVSSFLELKFFKDYYYGAIYRSEEAMSAFVAMAVAVCVSTLLFVCVCIAVLRALSRVIDEHVGAHSVTGAVADGAQLKMAEETRRELKRNFAYCGVGTLLYAASDIAYVFLAPSYGVMLLVNVIGALVCGFCYVKTYSELLNAVDAKYLLE